jgi:hypothetical protein
VGNLSLVFHVASLVVFLALGAWILIQARSLMLWRDWGSYGSHLRIHVGEPIRVLRRFAAAIGADFETQVGLNAFPPSRLSLKSAFELHRLGFIERIIIKKSPKLCVCFVLRHKPGTIGFDSATLSRDLGAELLFE